MVVGWAADIAGHEPGHNWASDFKKRNLEVLDSRYLDTLDISRHKADSFEAFQEYFDQVRKKIAMHKILPENMYNMDEKGFLIGQVHKSRRFFSKALQKSQGLLGSNQDGSRDWITMLATICADGSVLPPALIYKAISGDVQDSWLKDFDAQEHQVWFKSSPNGWTNNDLAVSWLNQVFEAHTKRKAGTGWRLLVVDGHSSHASLQFMNTCWDYKIALAFFPAHSTHRLQPCDVSMFRPLAARYSHQVDEFTRQSRGLRKFSKREFFKAFWVAFKESFTESNVRSAFLKTGLEPFDPSIVLKALRTEPQMEESSSQSSSCLNSPSKARKIRRIVQDELRAPEVSPEALTKIAEAALVNSASTLLLRDEVQGLTRALEESEAEAKRPRSKPLLEQFKDVQGTKHLFLGPEEYQQINELDKENKAQKQAEVREKAAEAEARKQKQDKAKAEAQKKREQKAKDRLEKQARDQAASEHRILQKAAKKAAQDAKRKEREAERLQKRLARGKTTRTTSKGRSKQQKSKQHASEGQKPSKNLKKTKFDYPERRSRSGRLISLPAHLQE